MRTGPHIAFIVACSIACSEIGAEPWRLDEAMESPGWLSVGGSYRVRYEFLDNPFRPLSDDSDELLVERLLLDVRGNWSRFNAGIELQDSRAQLADARTPLGTDDVNALEPLQAYVGLGLQDVFETGDRLDLAVGRLTIDAGSRRLVARNGFRNTINAFTGLHAAWAATGTRVRVFVVVPVERLPNEPARIRDNDVELDEAHSGARFWALLISRDGLFGAFDGELYAFGLYEDAPGLPGTDRDLLTPGFRLAAEPSAGAWDFEIEAALQTGRSRQTIRPEDTRDPDHRAGFVHLQVGRSFEVAWSPRVALEYDYASGDDSPQDGENNRFDTLYGARRLDSGPTGIYGALARANIRSPGVRLDLAPGPRTQLNAVYRAVWLASPTDALTGAGLRDPSGASGRFVGHQLEVLARYSVLPGSVELQLGGAWLIDGEFLENAPDAPSTGNSLYLFGQASLSF